jgi:two-component system, LuxR family, response regulator FixJ
MAVEAMRQGAFDFLQKPFRDQDLVDRVQEALKHDGEMRQTLREHGRIRARIASLTPQQCVAVNGLGRNLESRARG